RMVRSAVNDIQMLAEQGAGLDRLGRGDAFARMQQLTSAMDFTAGVVRRDANRTPWSWGGSFRLLPDAGVRTTSRVTPYYVVVEGNASVGDWSATAQGLIWARPDLPESSHSVAAAFGRLTGFETEFFRPRGAPDDPDVFDYCIPDCDPAAGPADTLFSVRTIPPGQAEVVARSRKAGALVVLVAILGALAALFAMRGLNGRRIAVAGAVGLLLSTPVPGYLGFAEFFSPAFFFSPSLGPLSHSLGAQFVAGALLVLVAVRLWRMQLPRTTLGFVVSMILVAGAPYGLREFAHGITAPADGGGVGLWVAWQAVLAVSASGVLLLAASVIRGREVELPPWVTGITIGWTAVTATVGLLTWTPGPGAAWPEWYTFLWIPALILAVQPAGTMRLILTVGTVGGTAAALLTWGSVVEGRMVLAERDAELLGEEVDLGALSLLQAVGDGLVGKAAASTEADLFEIWYRAGLGDQHYPASLVQYDSMGASVARLDFARLDLNDENLAGLRERSRGEAETVVEHFRTNLGRHYALAVPGEGADKGTLLVVLGSGSQLIAPTATGRTLWARHRVAPYQLTLSDYESRFGSRIRTTWTRDGWNVVGVRLLAVPSGERRLQATVSLGGGAGQLGVRGVLVVMVSVSIVLALWLLGELLAGRVELGSRIVEAVRPSAFRTRLAVGLALFFVAPTIVFAGWTVVRLGSEAGRNYELRLGQELHDISLVLPRSETLADPRIISNAADRYELDLSLYRDGHLVQTTNSLFAALGLTEPLLPGPVFRSLEIDERDTRLSGMKAFRALDRSGRNGLVLATASAVPLEQTTHPQLNLIFIVLLATIVGFGAAALLARGVASSLTHPMKALSSAAAAIGSGRRAQLVVPKVPRELSPVVEAFERMERDVREHQNALESTVRFTSAILRNVGTGVVALDSELRVATANPSAETLLEVTFASGISIRTQTLDDWRPVWDWVSRFLDGRSELDAREFSVGARRIQARVARLEGAAEGCVVALDDATDLARAERVIAWGEMARQVAHEIKNPLTPIRLGMQYLVRAYQHRRQDFEESLHATSQQILGEIERLDAIASAFSRFGSPAAEATPLVVVKVGEVAVDTANLYSMAGGEVKVVGDLSVEAMARPDELKEVLVNVIENARNAAATSVEIRLRSVGGFVELQVRDDGNGIPREYLPYVFEPRFSTTTSGTGLGLAISKRIVESWEAGISITQSTPAGTIVTLRLRGSNV
ncbi:MAG: PAS domain-containing sensor histidine kinase, partial [Gemmatimonadales bacterium]